MKFHNTFGAAATAQGIDLQRVDLWKVTIMLPQVLNMDWKENVEFALENFPFPDHSREMIPVKYMQQTNHLIGADTATSAVEIKVRYAFQQQTLEALTKWNYLCANPQTGGVGLTSACKAKGYMHWMVPNMQQQLQDIRGNAVPGENTMDEGLTYVLEGCIIKGLKFADADMTQSGYVTANFSLSVDRVYPEDVNNMVVIAR